MPPVKVHHTATTDEPWDGPAAVAAMPNDEDTLRYCHAWYSADGDLSEKGSWKFPHAKSKGGPANLAACRNGLARLPDADIPDGDRAGVKAHLQAHLDDAEGTDDRMRRNLPTALLNVAWPKAVMRAHVSGSPKAGAPMPMDGRKPFAISNAASGDSAEVWLYDEIGGWGIWAEDVISALARVTASAITVRINSPGGDYFDGIAIMNALLSHPATVTVQIDGLAASIASVIALAGDRVVMGPGTKQMVHNASTMVWGDANDLRSSATLLDEISAGIAEAYAARSGGDVAEWAALMDAETWLSAEQCVTRGLADEVTSLASRAGMDPDPDNQDTTSGRAPVAAVLRPAALLDPSVSAPTDGELAEGTIRDADTTTPADPVPAQEEEPAAPAGPAAAVLGQALSWWTVIDQVSDRACAQLAATLGVPNPDVDAPMEAQPLPAGPAGLSTLLGMLTSVDTIVDGGQVIVAAALGICNPDPDADDDAGESGEAPEGTGPGMSDDTAPIVVTAQEETWDQIIDNMFAAPTDPVMAALEGVLS